METHIHTGQRRYLTADGIISLLIAVGCVVAAFWSWHMWSGTGDGQLGVAMFSLGAICFTALRDFWEGSEVLVCLEQPDALVPLEEADAESLDVLVERIANRTADQDR